MKADRLSATDDGGLLFIHLVDRVESLCPLFRIVLYILCYL